MRSCKKLRWKHTSPSTGFAVVPTRWSDYSHSTNFHASRQDTVSMQNHLSFRAHHLALPLAWSCSVRLLTLGLRQKHDIRNTSCQYRWLKTATSAGCPRDYLRKCCKVITAFPSRLQDCIDMVVTRTVPKSNSTDSDEFSWTWSVPAGVNKIFQFALKFYFISKTVRCFWSTL